jgi:D-alanyl-lipoteichoic acid acyltransferase DltB (MBOAT superfamily)
MLNPAFNPAQTFVYVGRKLALNLLLLLHSSVNANFNRQPTKWKKNNYTMLFSFFPLMVDSPIEKANHMLAQLQKSRFFNYAQVVEGCRLIKLKYW